MDNKIVSVCIPTRNESQEEIRLTLKTAQDTASNLNDYELILIDDNSDVNVVLPKDVCGDNVKIIRNKNRLGVDRSRHVAAEAASGEMLLIIDGHSRFQPNWLNVVTSVKEDRLTAWNGVCLGLWDGEPEKPSAELPKYYGAYLETEKDNEIFEGKWMTKKRDDCRLSCFMGAVYLLRRDMFFKVGGLKSLKGGWGSSEPFLAAKLIRSGIDIKLLPSLEIAHVFRRSTPYATPIWEISYNKLRAIYETIDDKQLLNKLVDKLCKTDSYFIQAKNKIMMDIKEIEAEKQKLSYVFIKPYSEILQQTKNILN